MRFEENKSLQLLNTLGFEQRAQWYCQPTSISELAEAIDYANQQKLQIFMLGGGSNIVLTQDIEGLTIRLNTDSVSFTYPPTHKGNGVDTKCLVHCDAGLNWHQLVRRTLQQGLSGLENLSLIPGSCGAAPIQNIGAYGVELADRLVKLRAIHLQTGEQLSLTNSDCQFGYRDSIFKHSLRQQLAITDVTLKLSTRSEVNTNYQILTDALEKKSITTPTPEQVSETICEIRSARLPDPNVLGNVGSFFKNPIISERKLEMLTRQHAAMPYHRAKSGSYKIPAAWLIDQCGWKGYQRGQIGVHSQQALVLVHFGGANGRQLLALAEEINQSVYDKFGVKLDQEPVTL